MKILNEYPNSHHYWDEYEYTDYHCPNCGAQSVWAQQGEGDYYLGADFVCISCKMNWTMQGPYAPSAVNEHSIINQLQTGVTATPTTRPGQ